MPQFRPVVPAGVDRKAFKAFHRKAQLELQRDAKAFHASRLASGRALTKSAATTTRLIKASRREARELLKQHLESKAQRQLLKAHARPRVLRGHNPSKYSPYSFPWSWMSAGGIGTAFFYTIDAQWGTLGADLGDFIGGSGSAASAMGFWYQAQSNGSLFVSAQIGVNGSAGAYAFPGYAHADAFVKVFVQQWDPWYSMSAQGTIWNRSQYAFGVDVDYNIGGNYTASIIAPIKAGGWYVLWGAIYQNVTAGGIATAVSNFNSTVGPISYFEI